MWDSVKSTMIATTAYTAPSLMDTDIENLPLISKDLALKITDLYIDEAHKLIRDLNVRPLNLETLAEDSYLLCNDILLYIGRFYGGTIPANEILKAVRICNFDRISIHTHPIPLPIPTIEDLVNSYQLSLRSECVVSKLSSSYAKAVCIEPTKSWSRVLNLYAKLLPEILDKISRYIVAEDHGGLVLIPYPTIDDLNHIEKLVLETLSDYAYIEILSIDLNRKEFEYSRPRIP